MVGYFIVGQTVDGDLHLRPCVQEIPGGNGQQVVGQNGRGRDPDEANFGVFQLKESVSANMPSADGALRNKHARLTRRQHQSLTCLKCKFMKLLRRDMRFNDLTLSCSRGVKR